MKSLIISVMLLFVFTGVAAQEKEVNFGRKYVRDNDQKTTIEISEAQELVYIILAITDFAKENPGMTKQGTEYFNDVQAHFSQFSDLAVVHAFDKLLRHNVVNYFLLAGNAYGFQFEGERLHPTRVYNFPAKGIGKYKITVNPITVHLQELEEFVRKSDYRGFYKSHKCYYDSLKTEYRKYATIGEQKEWLESHFDYNINSYRVLTSPLIAGMNATHTFEDNGFKEILLFLPTIRDEKGWTADVKKAMNSRIIFTEIDHNYVGPVSEKYLERIQRVFNNRDKWINIGNKSTEHYPSPIKVYDEYLTWGLFLLYAYDKFGEDKALFQQIVDNVNDMMINKKGFPKAREFNAELLRYYKSGLYAKIEQLYKPLLEWSESQ